MHRVGHLGKTPFGVIVDHMVGTEQHGKVVCILRVALAHLLHGGVQENIGKAAAAKLWMSSDAAYPGDRQALSADPHGTVHDADVTDQLAAQPAHDIPG